MEESIMSSSSETTNDTKKSYVLPIIISSVVVMIGIYGGYLWSQKTKVKTSPISTSNSSPISSSTQLPVAKTSDVTIPTQSTLDWQLYTNKAYGFTIQYPKNWKKLEGDTIGFGPTEIAEDVLWTINVYPVTSNLEDLESEIGSQFEDMVGESSLYKNNANNKIEEYVVRSPSNPNWYSKTVIFKDSKNYYFVSNGAISNENLAKKPGVPVGTTFEQFYQSFKLTK